MMPAERRGDQRHADAGRGRESPITSRAGQSRPYPAVINTRMFLLPVRLGLHLWPFFNVVFFENNLQVLSAVGLCGHACRSHLPLPADDTRGQQPAGTTCLRRRVAVRVRQAGSSGFPDPQQLVPTSSSSSESAIKVRLVCGLVHARTGCCCWLLQLRESLC